MQAAIICLAYISSLIIYPTFSSNQDQISSYHRTIACSPVFSQFIQFYFRPSNRQNHFQKHKYFLTYRSLIFIDLVSSETEQYCEGTREMYAVPRICMVCPRIRELDCQLYLPIVIIKQLMRGQMPGPQGSVLSSEEEEHDILNELTRIDQRLRSRVESKVTNEPWRQKPDSHQQDPFTQKKWHNEKDSTGFPIYNANMEYFSEICGEEVDDDSLFDPNSNFLAQPKPLPRRETADIDPEGKDSLKRRDNRTGHEKENQPLNSQFQGQSMSSSQLFKQKNYVYRKEAPAYPQHTPKVAALPPKNSRLIGNSKGSTHQLKTQERKSSSFLRIAETTPENLLQKVASKQKYKFKPLITEQRQVQDDPNQFKFHTFQPYPENNDSNQVEEKSCKQYAKQKTVPQDKNTLQCTFKPTILKKSAQIAKSSKSVVQRLSTSGQPARDQKKAYQPSQPQYRQHLNLDRLEELSQPRRLKTQGPDQADQVPSFRPSLSKKSLDQMSNCMYDVATRNEIWQRQREEKIERMRQEEERERQKRQKCTYSPSLCQYKGENAPNLSRFGRQGISNYFQRLSGLTKANSQVKLNDCSQENRQNAMNMSKQSYNSKGMKKQKYEDAVRQLHHRINSLKI